jgi:Ca2+-binding EF-hand superfamily protein
VLSRLSPFEDIIGYIEMVSKADMVSMAYKLFESYDKDDSGYLDPAEFRVVMTEVFNEVNKSYSVEKSHLNKVFTICDANGDKKLTRKEFGKAVELFLEPVYLDVK